jgi:hypothetical protein
LGIYPDITNIEGTTATDAKIKGLVGVPECTRFGRYLGIA